MLFYYSAIWDTVLIFYNHHDSWFLYLLLSGEGHIQQRSTYRAGQGVLGRPMATAAAMEMSSHCWWMSFGAQTPELQHIAVRVLSQVTSAGSWTGRHSNLYTVRNATDWHVRQLRNVVKVHCNLRLVDRDEEIGHHEDNADWSSDSDSEWTWAFADFWSVIFIIEMRRKLVEVNCTAWLQYWE